MSNDTNQNSSPKKDTQPKSEEEVQNQKLPNLFLALLPILTMIVLMVYVFGVVADSDVYDAAHMPLICGIIVACIVAFSCHRTFKSFLHAIMKRLSTSLEAILILLLVGLLIAAFMLSGTIPALIYYGLGFLTPQVFLPIGCIICAIVGLACGSSWTATATVGIAFMTIGAGLGINPALTAGMIISGAYVGDKLSPLSDTTNLAAAVAEIDLFDHVRAMMSTTIPVFIIALILYTILGLNVETTGYDATIANDIREALAATFNLNPLVLLPIAVVLVVCVLRVPGLLGVGISIIVGIVFMFIFQQSMSLAELFSFLHYGPQITTGNELVDVALAKGGLENQLWTISLVILAVAYGGALEGCGTIERIFSGLANSLHKVGTLVGSTLLTSIACDILMCDQYLGIGVPAPLFAPRYDQMGLSRKMLSRSLEDAGTMWSPLFPWTACGAYQMGVLGVSTFAFFPFAFVNLLSPFYSFVTAMLKRNIFWADGAYTNILGKTHPGKPAICPEEIQDVALDALEKARAEGRAPIPVEHK